VLQHGLTKKLFLFDIDGTLLASGGAGWRALEAACIDLFGTPDLDGIEIAGRTDSSIARQLYARRNEIATPENCTRFYDCYLKYLTHFLPLSDGALLPGIIEMLEILKDRPDCVLALLTGNLVRGAELKLTHYGLWHYFEFGAYADDHHDRNELGVFARTRAKEKHGIEFAPQDTIVLGDTPHDITCARAIGAKAVAIATGRHTRAELEACKPDLLFDDLSDVRGALKAMGID
jgi:phosphoglycolate phosphatase